MHFLIFFLRKIGVQTVYGVVSSRLFGALMEDLSHLYFEIFFLGLLGRKAGKKVVEISLP